jgi:hypothetical protein
MGMQVQGVVYGKQIELDHETGLPQGAVVIVNIQPVSLTLEEKRRLVDSLCGVWKNDASIPSVFAEIERQRAMTVPRRVDFDVAP